MTKSDVKRRVVRLLKWVKGGARKTSDVAVTFARNDHIHICVDIEKVPGGAVVTAKCLDSAYKKLRSINAIKRQSRTKIMRRVISSVDGVTTYEAYLPDSVLTGRVRFEAANFKGISARIWTFGRLGLKLPEHWHTGNYHLILYYDDKRPPGIVPGLRLPKIYLRSIERDKGSLRFQFYAYGLDLSGELDAELVIFKFRDEAIMASAPMSVTQAKNAFRIPRRLHQEAVGQNVISLSASVDIESLFSSNGLYSILVRIGEYPLRGIAPYNEIHKDPRKLFEFEGQEDFRVVYQISDHASKTIRLEYYRFPESQREMVQSFISGEALDVSQADRPVWLIGEYPNTARDNGWRIFQYIRDARPDIDARYVIARENLDAIDISEEGVVELGSLQHLELSCRAEAILFTHHAIYPFPRLISDVKAARGLWTLEFFLQHGVLAIKPMLAHYERGLHKSYDLFNVSSERERALVASRCRWKPEDIVVAGLPRWDALAQSNGAFDAASLTPDRILIFPTWRVGLDKLDEDDFQATEFYQNWSEAIERISQKAVRAGLAVDFCAHSILTRFGDLFTGTDVNIVSMREAVDRIPSYRLLVTDYSSLCFDFLYLNKPTYFFMFDKQDFFSREAPYIDIERELPGFAAETISELLRSMFNRVGNVKRTPTTTLRKQRERFIGVGDGGGNSARVVDAAIARINLRIGQSASLE